MKKKLTTRKVDETHRERLTALARALVEARTRLANATVERMNLERQEREAAKAIADVGATLQAAIKEVAVSMGITAPLERVNFDFDRFVFTIQQ